MKAALWVTVAAVLVALGAATVVLWPRSDDGPPSTPLPAEPAPVVPPSQTSHISATVYYGAASGAGLAARRVEVPLASTAAAQGEAILRASLADAPSGTVRVVPRGTRLRAFFVDAQGTAYVDLTSEVRRLHPGGSFFEALTVAALVNAVTANLSAVRRVQLLVDGLAVETLAGHIDVGRPLVQDLSLVVTAAPQTGKRVPEAPPR
jgi:germination protein M